MNNRTFYIDSDLEKVKTKESAFLSIPERITALLEKESDRGAILILATYIEEILGILVAAACMSDALADNILKHGQPAGTFDARMMLAQAFGMIHEEDVKGLRIIQKIRNKAAHFDRSGRGFDVLFDSPSTADQVVELSALFYEKLTDRNPLAVRLSFIESARNVANRLLMRRQDIKRPTAVKSTQELIAEALEMQADTPLAGLLDKLKQLKYSPEGKATYQSSMHVFSKMILNSRASADGNGLPDEMLLAISDLFSRRLPEFFTSEDDQQA